MTDNDQIKEVFLERLQSQGSTYIPNDQYRLRRIVRELADAGKVFLDDSGVMDLVKLPVKLNEDDECPYSDCDGIIGWSQYACYCNATNAPCGACENAYLACCECEYDQEGPTIHVAAWDKRIERKKFEASEGSW